MQRLNKEHIHMGYNNDDRGGSRGSGGYGNRNSGGGYGGGGRSGGGNRGGYGDREERVMHKATCDNCGNNCEVPFKPTGNKPVLCSDCFRKDKPERRDDRGDRGFDRPRRDFGGDNRPRRDDRAPRMSEGRSEHYEVEFEKLNAKLDKILDRLTPKHTRDGVKVVEPEDIDPDEFI